MNVASQVLLENLSTEGIQWTFSQSRFPSRIGPSIMVRLTVHDGEAVVTGCTPGCTVWCKKSPKRSRP